VVVRVPSYTLSLGSTYRVGADVGAWHTVNQAEFQQMLRGSNGAVAKNMLTRLLRVEAAAKKNLDTDPRRIDTGHLRSSITHEFALGSSWVGRVGTNVDYAPYVHDGTGIYGPRHQLIRPVTKKALRWRTKTGGKSGAGGYTFSKWSRGMRPNRFLKNAMNAAKIG